MALLAFLSAVCLGLILCVSLTETRSSRIKRSATDNCPTPPATDNGNVECLPDALGLDVYCSFTCKKGYSFQGVTDEEILFVCEVNTGFTVNPTTPPCVAKCDSPCLNGGKCIAPNTCQCVDDWHGSQCEHKPVLCADPPPGRFGTVSCEPGEDGTKVCIPHCFQNYMFETPPPQQLVCSKDGTWTPDVATIPNCVPEDISTSSTTTATVTVPKKTIDAVCAVWGTNHFRTLDNKVYNFQGRCSYTLVLAPGAFEVVLVNDPACTSSSTTCDRQVRILQGTDTVLLHTSANGPEITWNNQVITMPDFKGGTIFEKIGNYMTVKSTLGYSIKWDGKLSVFVQISEDLKNKILGLCGKYNGLATDDFTDQQGHLLTSPAEFGASWKKITEGENACTDEEQPAGCASQPTAHQQSAQKTCGVISSDPAFIPCHQVVDLEPYEDSCQSDCCNTSSDSCMCDSMEAYSRACMDKGVKLTWRKQGRCEIPCKNGMVYKECGSPCVKDCSTVTTICADSACVDGCFCPDGTVLHNGNCITSDQCPCENEGRQYAQGDVIPQHCNNCTCNAGSWTCTHLICDKTCSATGDPHYETFDGYRYNFMGTCSYYLIKDRDFNIITDNIQCGHGEAACTKSITIHVNGQTILLDHNHQLYINDQEITTLPYDAPGIKVSMVSSLFMQAILSNGITVLWDGNTRAYIKAPPAFFGKTIGLCGTFDGNTDNDFLTEDGNIEHIPNAFGNHWKTDPKCSNMSVTIDQNPCDANPQKKANATALCDNLKSDIFKACHAVENVDGYYDDCIYDLCSCTGNMKECMCPNIGSYADTCAGKGVKISWRTHITECMVQCPAGQEYKVCANPCERTCKDISLNTDEFCDAKCVEGCNCPDNQTLGEDGKCVSISTCKCIFDGRVYPAGFTTLKESKFCVCMGGKFQCSNVPSIPHNIPPICPNNTVYSKCVSKCPLTCDNMNDPPTCSSEDCQAGCECLPGFVLDGEKCVNKATCPCRHAGRTFSEGESYRTNCNECTCKDYKWQCTANDCPSVCNAYGESHYTTFDGTHYEFQGTCEYVLVQSAEGNPNRFSLTTRNSQCGSSGVTCFKELNFVVGNEGLDNYYRLQLIRGQSVVPDPGSPFTVREIGDMVYISTPFGVNLLWDKQTRIYVQLSTEHVNKVEGLCGNFNHDSGDDFISSEGVLISKPTDFGDSWRLQNTCTPSREIEDTCEKNPQRKSWAQLRCSVLDSDLFKPCHNFVDREQYVKRCEYDACGCDMGGDCECLCTAISAYAHDCAVSGVPIQWRSNELCPLQCDHCEVYNPCISLCPKKTCENSQVYANISKECGKAKGLCFEGCDLRACPPGQVYDSLEEPITCVPEASCIPSTVCQINGRKYWEGEKVEDTSVCKSECEICICRGGTLEHITFGHCKSDIFTPTPGIDNSSPTPSYYETRTPPVIPHKVCDELLGLNSKDVVNDQFTASSSQSVDFEAYQARLFNTHSGPDNGGAWVPRKSDQAPYISVDLRDVKIITGVAIQGQPDVSHWVTKFIVSLSIDGANFITYLDSTDTNPKVFDGNYDRDTVVKAYFDRPINATFVRIYPLEWHEAAGLRMDIVTCYGKATPPNSEPTTRWPTGSVTGELSSYSTPGLHYSTSYVIWQSSTNLPSTPYTQNTAQDCKYWSPWVNKTAPDDIAGETENFFEAPLVGNSCTKDQVVGIECRVIKTQVMYDQNDPYLVCSMEDATFMCIVDESHKCDDYEIRVQCDTCSVTTPSVGSSSSMPSVPPVTTTPGEYQSTSAPTYFKETSTLATPTPYIAQDCKYWSPWVNRTAPDDITGETENFFQGPLVENSCTKEFVVGIECRVIKTQVMYDQNDPYLVCSMEDATFMCIVDESHKCDDYEIRVQCDTCSVTTPHITPSTYSTSFAPHGSTSVNVESTSSISNRLSTATGSYITSARQDIYSTPFSSSSQSTYSSKPCFSRWSGWIDNNSPVSTRGDYEKMTPEELYQFCPDGNITEVDCVDSVDHTSFSSFFEASCTIEHGLECENDPALNVPCHNYMIRYYCQCSDGSSENTHEYSTYTAPSGSPGKTNEFSTFTPPTPYKLDTSRNTFESSSSSPSSGNPGKTNEFSTFTPPTPYKIDTSRNTFESSSSSPSSGSSGNTNEYSTFTAPSGSPGKTNEFSTFTPPTPYKLDTSRNTFESSSSSPSSGNPGKTNEFSTFTPPTPYKIDTSRNTFESSSSSPSSGSSGNTNEYSTFTAPSGSSGKTNEFSTFTPPTPYKLDTSRNTFESSSSSPSSGGSGNTNEYSTFTAPSGSSGKTNEYSTFTPPTPYELDTSRNTFESSSSSPSSGSSENTNKYSTFTPPSGSSGKTNEFSTFTPPTPYKLDTSRNTFESSSSPSSGSSGNTNEYSTFTAPSGSSGKTNEFSTFTPPTPYKLDTSRNTFESSSSSPPSGSPGNTNEFSTFTASSGSSGNTNEYSTFTAPSESSGKTNEFSTFTAPSGSSGKTNEFSTSTPPTPYKIDTSKNTFKSSSSSPSSGSSENTHEYSTFTPPTPYKLDTSRNTVESSSSSPSSGSSGNTNEYSTFTPPTPYKINTSRNTFESFFSSPSSGSSENTNKYSTFTAPSESPEKTNEFSTFTPPTPYKIDTSRNTFESSSSSPYSGSSGNTNEYSTVTSPTPYKINTSRNTFKSSSSSPSSGISENTHVYSTFTPPSGSSGKTNEFSTFTPPTPYKIDTSRNTFETSSYSPSSGSSENTNEYSTFTPPSGSSGKTNEFSTFTPPTPYKLDTSRNTFESSSSSSSSGSSENTNEYSTFTAPSGSSGKTNEYSTFTPPTPYKLDTSRNTFQSSSSSPSSGSSENTNEYSNFTPPSGSSGKTNEFSTFTPPTPYKLDTSRNTFPSSSSSPSSGSSENTNEYSTFTPPSGSSGKTNEFSTFTPPTPYKLDTSRNTFETSSFSPSSGSHGDTNEYSTSTPPTPYKHDTSRVPVWSCSSGWSDWVNRNSPLNSIGDHEKMTDAELLYFCYGGEITEISCIDSDTGDDWLSLAEATCSVESGLECLNIPISFAPKCRDYKIRYYCMCPESTSFTFTKPTGSSHGFSSPTGNIYEHSTLTPPTPSKIDTSRNTFESSSSLPSSGSSGNTNEYSTLTPPTPYKLDTSRNTFETSSSSPSSGSSENTNEYSTFTPPSGSSGKTNEFSTFTPPTPYKIDTSKNTFESSSSSPSSGSSGNTHEYSTFTPPTPYKLDTSRNTVETSSYSPSSGSSENTNEYSTFTAPSESSGKTNEFSTFTPPTSSKIDTSRNTFESSSYSPSSGSHGDTNEYSTSTPPTPYKHDTSRVPVWSCSSGWSDWINRNSPLNSIGDHEKMTDAELLYFCYGGEITEISCIDSDTGDDWLSLAEATCSVESGLECLNIPISFAPKCRDYKIRYYCMCPESTSFTFTKPTGSSHGFSSPTGNIYEHSTLTPPTPSKIDTSRNTFESSSSSPSSGSSGNTNEYSTFTPPTPYKLDTSRNTFETSSYSPSSGSSENTNEYSTFTAPSESSGKTNEFSSFTPPTSSKIDTSRNTFESSSYSPSSGSHGDTNEYSTSTPPSGSSGKTNEYSTFTPPTPYKLDTSRNTFETSSYSPSSGSSENTNEYSTFTAPSESSGKTNEFSTFTPPTSSKIDTSRNTFESSSYSPSSGSHGDTNEYSTFTPPSGSSGKTNEFSTFTPPTPYKIDTSRNTFESSSSSPSSGSSENTNEYSTFTPPSGSSGKTNEFSTFTPPTPYKIDTSRNTFESSSSSPSSGSSGNTNEYSTFTPPTPYKLDTSRNTFETSSYSPSSGSSENTNEYSTFTAPSESSGKTNEFSSFTPPTSSKIDTSRNTFESSSYSPSSGSHGDTNEYSTSTPPTPYKHDTSRVPVWSCSSGWSDWINRNSPLNSIGDHEKMTDAELLYFCYGGEITEISCIDSDTGDDWLSLAEATCSVESGLECLNIPISFAPKCRDYKIRYYCMCPGSTSFTFTKPTGSSHGFSSPTGNIYEHSTLTPPTPSKIDTSRNTFESSSSSLSSGSSENTNEYSTFTPPSGSSGKTNEFSTFTPPTPYKLDTSRNTFESSSSSPSSGSSGNTNEYSTFTPPTPYKLDTSRNTFVTSSYSPSIGSHGDTNEYSTFTPPSGSHGNTNEYSTSTPPTPYKHDSSRVPVWSCSSGWSDWINRNSPLNSIGDHEKMTDAELLYFCYGGEITEISCIDSDTGDDWLSLAEATCSVESGLECLNIPIPFAPKCRDYKIRYYCMCPESTSFTFTKPTGSSHGFSSPTGNIYEHSTLTPPTPSKIDTSRNTFESSSSSPPSGSSGNTNEYSTNTSPTPFKIDTSRNTFESSSSSPSFGSSEWSSLTTGSTYEYDTTKTSSTSTQRSSSPTESVNGSSATTPEETTSKPDCKYWSPWVNRSKPDDNAGETENFFEAPLVGNSCTKDQVVGIECRVIKTQVMYDQNDPYLACSMEDAAFVCLADESHKCDDYEIRVQCDTCSATTTQISSSVQSSSSTSLRPHDMTTPYKIQVNCAWSPWLNADRPDSGIGDIESISEIKRTFGVCPNIIGIECRVTVGELLFSQSGQDHLSCDFNNGFRCYNSEQLDGRCLDYEVRVLCWSDQCTGPTPTLPTTASQLSTVSVFGTTHFCPPGEEWQKCAYHCEEVCDYMGRSRGSCNGILSPVDKCVPGCRQPPEMSHMTCSDTERFLDSHTCVPKPLCTCLKPDGTSAKPFETWENPHHKCSLCSCFNGEAICGNIEDCVTSTLPPLEPICGWSEWMNENKPNSVGETELLSDLKGRHGLCENPVRIVCRDVLTKKDASESGQVVTCDLEIGLKCFNNENSDKCHDYEVAVYCGCPCKCRFILLLLSWVSLL